jgi:hypothetical protein
VDGNRRMGSLHETRKKYVRKYTTCIREVLISSVESVPRLRKLVARFSQWNLWFNQRVAHVG